MTFSNSDEIFEHASRDESARKALLQRLRRVRKSLQCIFLLNIAFLIALALFHLSDVVPPVLRGDYGLLDSEKSMPTDIAILAIVLTTTFAFLSSFGAVDADHRVKMLILFDGLDRKQHNTNYTETGAAGQPDTPP